MGLLGGVLASALFKRAWKFASGQDDAPDADDLERGWTEVLVAAALQGAIFGLVKAAVHRTGAQTFRRRGH
uniref:Putative integral membrane protein n=2 Tax=Nonomuraea gerenzanensis TaxID=93944 RepID=A0A1M4ENL2_9ACTN|nr:putative integral membrane protein [Nonomuraea gerenzanensis]